MEASAAAQFVACSQVVLATDSCAAADVGAQREPSAGSGARPETFPLRKQVSLEDMSGVHVPAPLVTPTQASLIFHPAGKAIAASAASKRRSTVFSPEQCHWLEEWFAAYGVTKPPTHEWSQDALSAGRKLKNYERLLKGANEEHIRQDLRTHVEYLPQ